ncbi:aminoglycoside phosphotransferase family protein [Tissierella sp. MSJ-40]|uniref:Aminoglycoside phosphotransferase family protein n=1 Tax=Tissierella simiarum TaxID=2841534 RepID=A0ABS6EBN6_9FIRM|nr:aminoglycoside phosphotransferase family protein [Tissierella simiarum]MBU5439614.1 aminoglycoside phosphotransferase family protein [Tissierella simiarum]
MGIKKWREPIIDSFLIPLSKDIKLLSVDGYPHAGNDVFQCSGIKNGELINFYLKVSRQIGADIENEIEAINKLSNSNILVPQIIDSNIKYKYPFIATLEVQGKRLSNILSIYEENEILDQSLHYMPKFGENLGKIHSLDLSWDNVKPRKFHFHPDDEYLKKFNLIKAGDWLAENEPLAKTMTFIHGDHHYANILWKDGNISSVLDWELCGVGWKEFDIAWALILRPLQRFMKTRVEREAFLEGYNKYGSYDKKALNYCTVLIYMHFYSIGKVAKDNEYTEFVLKEIERIMKD